MGRIPPPIPLTYDDGVRHTNIRLIESSSGTRVELVPEVDPRQPGDCPCGCTARRREIYGYMWMAFWAMLVIGFLVFFVTSTSHR